MLRALKEAWEQLDAEVDQIVALAERIKSGEGLDDDRALDTANLGRLQARARGKAEILALFMTRYSVRRTGETPALWTADEVSTEAGKRRRMAVKGRRYVTTTTMSELVQYEQDDAWERDGHGFVQVAP